MKDKVIIIKEHPYMSETVKTALSTTLNNMYVAKYKDMLIVTDEYNGPDEPLFWITLNEPSGYGDKCEWYMFINEYIENTYAEIERR